jgi:hypothetical protein
MTPDMPLERHGLAEKMYAHQHLLGVLEDHVLCLGGDGLDFEGLTFDDYDMSIEIKGASPAGYELTEAQISLLKECGFLRCWVRYSIDTPAKERFYEFF